MSRWIAVTVAALLSLGCTERRVPAPSGYASTWHFPQGVEKDVDILFVVANTAGMAAEQHNLSRSFPRLIEALRSDALGDRIPNVHIGVVSSDLGAGDYGLPNCQVAGGDGKLQAQPRVAGCTPPSQPFISHADGVTNIKSGTRDPAEQVKEAFQCIAEIGTGGCGFQQSIESARRALDPKLKVNPGFIREDALLAVVFVATEDDCSARKPQLYDPSQSSLTDPLGPLTHFRCFEFGIRCDINDRTKPGPREDCKPAYDWLYTVDEYIEFFKGLKPPGRVLMFAVAGPVDTVEVGMDGQYPMLRASCQTSTTGLAGPAVRIKALLDGFGKDGFFNTGIDPSLKHDEPVNICIHDYSPALRLLGRKVAGRLSGVQCLASPPLTATGGLVCHQGVRLGDGEVCRQSCLERADCVVKELVNAGTSQEQATVIPRCTDGAFASPDDRSCGATCPCWRIVPRAGCRPELDGSPYGFEILRQRDAPKGAVAEVSCSISTHRWDSEEVAALPRCSI
jgi:hypothetical protein